jgi:hypothetical protein
MVGQELTPKVQPCFLIEHEVAGQAFSLINGRQYLMIINLFPEGGNMPNRIKRVNRLTVNTANGLPLQLFLKPTPARPKKPLPNCVTVSALFNAAGCRAPSMSATTKCPASCDRFRRAKLRPFKGRVGANAKSA